MKTLFIILALLLIGHASDDLHDHKDITHKTNKSSYTKKAEENIIGGMH